MEDADGQHAVPGPIMNAENVETPVRPVAPGAVTYGDKQPEGQVQSDETNRDKPDIGRQVDCRHSSSRVVVGCISRLQFSDAHSEDVLSRGANGL